MNTRTAILISLASCFLLYTPVKAQDETSSATTERPTSARTAPGSAAGVRLSGGQQAPDSSEEHAAGQAGESGDSLPKPDRSLIMPEVGEKSEGPEMVSLVEALSLTQARKVHFDRRFQSIYGSTTDLENLQVQISQRAGTVVHGAIIDETDDDITLDKSPCEQDLSVLQEPYEKKEIKEVRCGDETLKYVSVVKK